MKVDISNASPTAADSLRVCLIAPFPPPLGGMSIQAQKLATLLRREGIEITTINAVEDWAAVKKLIGIRTILRELRYLFRLSLGVRKSTVVHHLAASGPYFFLVSTPAIFLARLFGKRMVLNYRGGNAGAFLRSWGWLALPVVRLADLVAVPSAFLVKVFESHNIAAKLLPNIADTGRFLFRGRTQFAPRLLATRHLEPMYNVECLLRAFRIVQQKFPGAVLGIAGTGSEESRLRQLARDWRLQAEFYGAVSPQDMPKLYDRFDIFVNASNVDNFPGALVEAACSGLPIVTTVAGGIPEMLENGRTGFLVALNDDRAVAENVIQLIENPELASQVAQNARGWVQQFGWDSVFPQLLRCYGGTQLEIAHGAVGSL